MLANFSNRYGPFFFNGSVGCEHTAPFLNNINVDTNDIRSFPDPNFKGGIPLIKCNHKSPPLDSKGEGSLKIWIKQISIFVPYRGLVPCALPD